MTPPQRTNSSHSSPMVPVVIVAASLLTSGCQVIGTIFKAGAWTGIIVALLLVAVVGGAIAMLRRR